ncbi:Lrp/AsnC family transcriptional regulator [Candidatus Woesearchaeota archaeon]|nr:Lrp/AsnC family transcriptional regulator [Candidatus Woesearchaeota archaeon]
MADISLDARDRAILYYLDKDARQSISSIAKKIKLSKEVVNYRIKNLVKQGVIQDFSTIINGSKLGYVMYRVFFRFQNVDVEKEDEILKYLKSLPAVGWVVQLEEVYNISILIWAKDVFEFKETYDSMTKSYGEYFQKVLVTIVTQFCHFINNYLYNTNDFSMRAIGGKCELAQLDEVDLRIMGILTKDARTPLLNISKAANVSPNTVKHRMKKMIKEGIIVGFRPHINASILGYQHYRVFIQLIKQDQALKARIFEYLKINKNVIHITEAIGRGDLDFEMQVKNGGELYAHLEELRKNFGTQLQEYRTTLIKQEQLVSYFPKNSQII